MLKTYLWHSLFLVFICNSLLTPIYKESYLICYHENKPALENFSGARDIECLQGCFTFENVCFCQSNFKWTFHDELMLTELKCDTFFCEKNTVVNSYIPNSYCSEPEKSTIFNITDWLTEGRFQNFVSISTGHILNVFEKVDISFAYNKFEGNIFSIDLGSGLTTTSLEPSFSLKFTKDGEYTIQLFVKSARFPSFNTTLTLNVENPLFTAEISECHPNYHDGANISIIQCTGSLFGSANLLEWHFAKNHTYNQSIITSTTFSPLSSPCFYVCEEKLMRSVPNTWAAGTYHLSKQKLLTFGYLYGLELYAIQPASTFRVLIYRGHSIIQIHTISLVTGYNSFEFLTRSMVEPGDSVAFYLESSNILEAVEFLDNVIEVYTDDNLSATPGTTIKDITFRAELLVISRSNFKLSLSDIPTYVGIHEIIFKASNLNNDTKLSNSKFLLIPDGKTEISYDPAIEAVTGELYDVCLKIHNAATVLVTMETKNTSMGFFKNNVEISPTKIESFVETRSLLFTHCEKVIFKVDGKFTIHTSGMIRGERYTVGDIGIEVLPRITGLHISTGIPNNTFYQLMPINFKGTVDNYPYPLNFSWNFGDNATATNNQYTKYYLRAQSYSVTFSAFFKVAYNFTTILVNIINPFSIVGPIIIATGEALNLEFKSQIVADPGWTYSWYFHDSAVGVSGNRSSKQYTAPGVYDVSLKVNITEAILVETFQCTVYDLVTGLNISVREGDKALVHNKFRLVGSLLTGNNVEYIWSSDDFQILSTNNSEVTVISDIIADHTINLTVKNAISEQSLVKSFYIGNALIGLSVTTESYYALLGEPTMFTIHAKGVTGWTYKIHVPTEGQEFDSSSDINNVTFTTVGVQTIRFDVMFAGSFEFCNKISAVHCSFEIEVYVQFPITGMNLTYINSFGEEVATNNHIFSLVKEQVSANVVAFNGSEVSFNVYLEGYGIKVDAAVLNSENNWVLNIPLAGVIFWQTGTYTLKLIALNGVTNITKMYSIIVNEPIAGLELVTKPEFVLLGDSVSLNVSKQYGSNVTYIWSFNNENFITKKEYIDIPTKIQGAQTILLKASNPSSFLLLNHSIMVFPPIQRPYFLCKNIYTIPDKAIELNIGFSDGEYITIIMNIDGKDGEILLSDVNGETNITRKISFSGPGSYKIEVQFHNPTKLFTTKECTITVEEPVGSSYFKSAPNALIYVGDEVTFELTIIGGSSPKGVLLVETQDNIIIDQYELEMKDCLYTTYDCVYGIKRLVFDIGNRYHVHGTAYNHISSIDVTSQELLIIGMARGVDDYIEMVAESAVLGKTTKIHFMKRNDFTLYQCTINYGDGASHSIQTIDMMVTHTYNLPGEYTVSLRCLATIGLIQIEALAFVQLPLSIKGVYFPTDCLRHGDSFQIIVEIASKDMLTRHIRYSLVIDGRETLPKGVVDLEERTLALTVNVNDYLIAGEHLGMNLKVTNYVSTAKTLLRLCIVKSIDSLSCQTPVLWRYGVDTPFKVKVESDSPYNLKFFYGDGNEDEFQNIKTPGQHFLSKHMYRTTELIDYQIRAMNNVSVVWFNSSIEIIQGISNVTLLYDRYMAWPSATITIILDFSMIALFKSISLDYQIYYSDGTSTKYLQILQSEIEDNRFSLPPYKYQYPGCYNPTLTIRSQINSMVITSSIYISDFDKLEVNFDGASIQSNISKNDEYIFRNDYPITVSIKNANRTCYTYSVLIYDSAVMNKPLHNVSTEDTTIFVDSLFHKTGIYQIVVVATLLNAKKSISSVNVTLLTAVPSLHLLPGAKGLVNQDKEFLLATTADPSTITTLKLDFGDGTLSEMTPEFMDVTVKTFSLYGKFRYYVKMAHSYRNTGSYKVSVSAANDVSTTVSTLNLYVSDVHCERPRLEILTSGDGKIEVYYQKPVTILSLTRTDCGNMNKGLFEWQIFESSKWEFDNKVLSDGKTPMHLNAIMHDPSLNIPRRTLHAGFYVVKLTVQLAANGLDNSEQIYLVIVEDSMQAMIAGGSMQMLPWQEDVVLDASKSKDPNEEAPNLDYEWFCQVNENGEELKDCFGNTESTVQYFGPIWTIQKKTLLEGAEYTFNVIVRNKEKKRETSSKQKIILVDQAIPVIVVECTSNCGDFVNPSNRFALAVVCTNCESSVQMTYQWSMDPTSKPLDLKQNSLTSLQSTNLGIKADAFEADSVYMFMLEAKKSSGTSAVTKYEMKTSRPPYNGQCTITPSSGITLQTIYTVKCKDWISNVGSLNYHIFWKQMTKDNTTFSLQLLKYGPQDTLSFILSSGLESNDYVVGLRVKISDLFDGASFYDLIVQVKPILVTKDGVDIQTQLVNLTTGADNVVKKLSDEGDTQGLVQLIGTITNTLNDADVVGTNHTMTEDDKEKKIGQRKEMRTVMAKALSEINIQNFDNVKQTADTIGPLLQAPDEVNERTQELALQTMQNIVDYLEKDEEITKNEDPEKIRDLTAGVIKATGNLLQAAVVNSKISEAKNETNGSLQTVNNSNQKSDNVSRNALKILDNVVPLLFSGKLPGEKPTRISSETITVELSRQDTSQIQKNIETINGGSFKLPKNLFGIQNDTVVDSKMSTLSQNPFSWHVSANDIKSPISSLEFTTSDKKPLDVKDLPPDNQVEFFVPQVTQVPIISLNSSLVKKEGILVQKFTIEQDGASIVASADIPKNTSVRLYFARGYRPTKSLYDASHLILGEDNGDKKYFVFPCWRNTTQNYVGVEFVTSFLEVDVVIEDNFLFSMEIFVTGCVYFDEVEEIWTGKGCKVGPLTTVKTTHCLCNHLTWLASSFYIPPRKLELKSELAKLKNLDDYPALLATYCVIIGVSIICMVWARHKDLGDTDNNDPTYLRSPTNNNNQRASYHIAIYTGHRAGSGTTATPMLIMSAKESDSHTMILKNDEGRVLFKRGAVDTFIVSVDKKLGDLKYLTIWHDDSGKDPSWFLSRIAITDMSNNKQFHCFCNDWLALDQSDRKVSRVLPIATEKEMQSFENIFLAKTTRDLTDGHIWFSIITCPMRSHFTRLQRVFCCLALLLSTMLTNAMFYRVDETLPMGDEIEVSGMVFRWTNILIGIQSSLIVLPINILIVFLFRRAAPSVKKEIKEKQACYRAAKNILPRMTRMKEQRKDSVCQIMEHKDSSGLGINFGGLNKYRQLSSSLPNLSQQAEEGLFRDSVRSFHDSSFKIQHQMFMEKKEEVSLDDLQLSYKDIVIENEESIPAIPKFSISNFDGVRYWPHWVQYVAWFLSVAVSLVAGFFTLLYGLSFGKNEQAKWLFSFFISVFSDIVFNQPIKIIIVAALITLIFRKLKDDYILTEIDNYRNIDWGDSNETELLETLIDEEKGHRPLPPSRSYIEMTRKKRIYEAKMVDVVIEIVAYTLYLFLCLLIAYGHRDPDAFTMTENIENTFIVDKFDQVNSIPSFWDWSLNTLSPGLFDEFWYNGQLSYGDGFLADGNNFVLGRVRIRQVRVREETCLANNLFGLNVPICGGHFEEKLEDTTLQYCNQWVSCSKGSMPLYPGFWSYRENTISGSYDTKGRVGTYPGGGYIVDVGRSKLETDSAFRYLRRNNWLDSYSRAVMVDFTLFNSQANLYTMVTLLLEMPASGGAFTFKRILATRLDRYSSGFAVFLGACELLFLGLSLYYMIREVKKGKILKMNYFSGWQNWVELISFALVWAMFILLLVRAGIVRSAKSRYFNRPDTFINFESSALIDQAYGYTLACLVFILFIKFLKLLRFNRKMSLMFKTVSHASLDTKYFSVSFFIIAAAFSQLAHLIFLSSIFEYSSFVYTMETLFNMLLGSFDYDAMIDVAPRLGRLFFFAFFTFMTFILLNMYISIINESFAIVNQETRLQKNKYELIDFLKQRFKSFLPHFVTRKKRKQSADVDESQVLEEPCYSGSILNNTEHAHNNTKIVHFNPDELKGLSPLDICKLRVDRSEAITSALDKAVDRISMRVDDMIYEEKVEQRLWEYIVELARIKYNLPRLEILHEDYDGRGKHRAK